MSNILQFHPEQNMDDKPEIYMGNCTVQEFHGFQWQTKRIGKTAVNLDGEVIEQPEEEPNFRNPNRIHPLFIQRSEVEKKLKGLRAYVRHSGNDREKISNQITGFELMLKWNHGFDRAGAHPRPMTLWV